MVSQNPEYRPEVLPSELYDLQGTVQSMGALFGLSGLSVVIAPGQGWSCSSEKYGIQISVDPLQLVRERNPETDAAPIEIRSEEILHTTGHELGHARDMVSDGAALPRPKNLSEHFFWNIIHDTVIDTRLRKVPLFDAVTDDLYTQQLFPVADMRDLPKHVQFMHGILLRTVVREGEYVFADDIEQRLAALIDHQLPNGSEVNILEVMTNLRTTVHERVMIARKYIWPFYQSLLRQDTSDKKTETSESQQSLKPHQSGGASKEQFTADYEKYELVMHGKKSDASSQPTDKPSGEQSQSSSDDREQQGSDASDNNQTGNSHVSELAELIVISEAQKTIQSAGMLVLSQMSLMEPATDRADASGRLAGHIQQEMNLEPHEAHSYAMVLQQYRKAISETADTLLMIANESETLTAPRYRSRANLEGKRLHPSRLSAAAIQAITLQPRAIWQPIAPRANKAELLFGGLDIHLLVDVSESMAGGKAPYAASTGVVLCEAIELARYRSRESSGTYQTPDVRAQIIAFGSGAQVLAPLSDAATPLQKGSMFHHLLHPRSYSTYVAGALRKVEQDVRAADGGREHLVLIITDGNFSDHDVATKAVSELPDNCEAVQINIQHTPDAGSISKEAVTIEQANDLPRQLYLALKKDLLRGL